MSVSSTHETEKVIAEARNFERAERIQGHEVQADRYGRFADAITALLSVVDARDKVIANAKVYAEQHGQLPTLLRILNGDDQ